MLFSCCGARYETVDVRFEWWGTTFQPSVGVGQRWERRIIQKCTQCGATRFVRTILSERPGEKLRA